MHRRRRGRRLLSTRRREERQRIIRRRVLMMTGVLLLAGMAMAPQLRQTLADLAARGMDAVQTLAWSYAAQAQITLPEKTVYALQLGAYENGTHAQEALSRLTEEGELCVIWQREQMRLVCDAAESKGKLNAQSAGGSDAWVLQEKLPEVVLRVDADAGAIDAVRSLITLPDGLFARLCVQEKDIGEIIALTKEEATDAQGAHPDNALYTQLVQSLLNWCQLMESVRETHEEALVLSYARVTMCTLCYELRQALIAQSAASMASAQRTPSTAAEVMPPA